MKGRLSANDSCCENCDTPTQRQCARCGQRICVGCAKDHPARNYEEPQTLWKKCVIGTKR